MGRVTLEEWIEQQRRVVKGVLTLREHRFLSLAAKGHSVKEIAGIVELSESTVRESLNLVVERLGARDRVDCIRLAKERGLIGVPLRRAAPAQPPPPPPQPAPAPEAQLFEKVGMIYRAVS